MLPKEAKIGRSLPPEPAGRSHGPGRGRNRRTVSVLLACVTVAALVSGAALVSMANEKDATPGPDIPAGDFDIPGFPWFLVGVTRDGSANPLPYCDVTITNLRTAEVVTTQSNDIGEYQYDLNTLVLGWIDGDEMHVQAVKDSLSGEATGTIVESEYYLKVDVTLDTVIPEFSMVVVPVAGMLVLFAVVGRRRRDRKA